MDFSFARLLWACSLLGASALLWADEAGGPPRAGVLLLHNGELIRGKVVRSAEHYVVEVDRGELRIRATDVECLAQSADECYLHRRDAIEGGKAEDHLGLAEWCIRHDLHERAAGELKQALAIDPTHPKLALVERRLELAQRKPSASSATKDKPKRGVSVEDLDRLVRGLPDGSVETFTNVVQPLLLHHCGAAACHGAQSKAALHLARVPAGRSPMRRATQRNLHAVLANVDLENPEASALLTAPVRPHGTSRTAVFNSRRAEQYRVLAEWVHSVAGKPVRAAAPEPVAESVANGDESTAEPASAEEPIEEEDADADAEQKPPPRSRPGGSPLMRSRTAPKHRPTAGQSPKRAKPMRADPAKGYVPKDPFDAELFNREAEAAKREQP
jgi:hypothetical protein